MKIKFDSNQEYQLDAVRAAVDVFDGQPLAVGPHEVRLDATPGDFFLEIGVGNQLLLTDKKILENLQAVQKNNGLSVSESLEGLNFTVEMETGTGDFDRAGFDRAEADAQRRGTISSRSGGHSSTWIVMG